MAQGVAERYTMRKTKGEGDNLENKMCFLLSNKNICLKRKNLTYIIETGQDFYVKALQGSTHLFAKQMKCALLEKINLTFF
jgi:hypothetical protein